MGFDLRAVQAAIAKHGPVVRVVIARINGSTPREVGTAMLVWQDGQEGTIGGGTLEWEAVARARAILQSGGSDSLTRHALGPDLGQCCGGAVQLLHELYVATRAAALEGQTVIARTTDGTQMPLSVQRLLNTARAQGTTPDPQLLDGWLVEPLHVPSHPLWIWGAGHVGRALVHTLASLPDLEITWVDTAPDRFPHTVPHGVTVIPAARPELLMPRAPNHAHHLILTYSHALDLALCHAALSHAFASTGLIGSATKWARFRSRLAALGHSPEQIARIDCPIGRPDMGKHPQAIAIGVATTLLSRMTHQTTRKDQTA